MVRPLLSVTNVMRATAAATALSLLTACSFIAARGPTGDRRFGDAPSCHSSSGSIAVDGLTSVAGMAVGLSGNDGVDVVGGLIGAIYLGSAIYGYSATKRCDKALSDYDNELASIERGEEHAHERERRAQAQAAATAPPPVLRPAPIARPAPPPAAVAPPVVAPRPVAPASGVIDPFAPAPATDADTPDTDATETADTDHEAPAGDDASAEELELRWREFWRRLP